MSQKKIALKQKEIKFESSSDEETNSGVKTSSDEESDNETGEKSDNKLEKRTMYSQIMNQSKN